MSNGISVKEKVYESIIIDILSYEYRPGEILNEKQLVDKYGCSKTPVREALLALCDENVLRCLPRYGYEVVRITSDDIKDMLQFRYVLETGLLRNSYKEFSEEQIQKLERIDKDCTKSSKDLWEHWKHNTLFHEMIVSFCDNAYAGTMISNVMKRLKYAYVQQNWKTRNENLAKLDTQYHKKIIECLREKDIDNLCEYIKKDLEDFGGRKYIFP